jgi:nucleotide-binding universal stress UspA family protein
VYEHTVVGWDGSSPADAAVEWAAQRVSRRTNRLSIVRAVDDTGLYTDETDTRWAVALATFALAELAARLRAARPGLDVTTDVVRGEPSAVLSALTSSDSLVVVGTESGQVDEFWYGSRVGARLAALVHGAIAVIPIGDSGPRAGVLVGVDGSAESTVLCVFAAELAQSAGEVLDAVFVAPAPSALAGTPAAAAAAWYDRVLDRALTPAVRAHPALPINRHVESGRPDAVLLRYAKAAAVVVVGTRRPGVIRRLFLGSASQALVNNARCPTIVVSQETDDATVWNDSDARGGQVAR